MSKAAKWLVVLAAACAGQISLAGDIEAGKQKAVKCMACHGLDGVGKAPAWPNIAGQEEEYLVKQLRAFREGERRDESMQPMVATLSEKDILDLAAFYASLGVGECAQPSLP